MAESTSRNKIESEASNLGTRVKTGKFKTHLARSDDKMG
jgi:hypothetical protein